MEVEIIVSGYWMDACGLNRRNCAKLLHDHNIADGKTMVTNYQRAVDNHRPAAEILALDTYF
jgi:hypothetical protein